MAESAKNEKTKKPGFFKGVKAEYKKISGRDATIFETKAFNGAQFVRL